MSSSRVDAAVVLARAVRFTADHLVVDLADGRSLSIPLEWYPRLALATPQERDQWELIGRGQGVHWPRLDEDLSVESLLAGRRSSESQTSLDRWLAARTKTSPP